MQHQRLKIPRVYPITDVRISGLSHAKQVRRLIAGGATFVQLREKYAAPRDFLDDALEAVAAAREHRVKVIINDRVDIALIAGADGVHLGQDDMPPDKAREVLGDGAIIGFSTHSPEQALRAMDMPIDYLAIGPAFPTGTKEDPDAVIGIEGIRNVRDIAVGMPLVAIGGITPETAASVLAAGCDSVAMIGAIVGKPDSITETVRNLLTRLK